MRRHSFERQLELGRLGEEHVTEFLKFRGCGVIPSYEFSGSGGKEAPRLMFFDRGLVVPDLDVAKEGTRRWLEVKTYDHPEHFKVHGIDTHGIKRRHRDSYLEVERETGCPVYLAVLEVRSGWLLLARLADLRVYACMCRHCRREGESRPRCDVYFDRAEFRQYHRFSDSEMAKIRRAFETEAA